jgi:hypothetical protein
MENFKLVVPGIGFELESNKTYRIEGRVDTDAPIAWQKQGISRLQHPLNSLPAIVTFDPTVNMWDTGLYASSPCYAADPTIAKDNVEAFEKNLKEMLEQMLPKDALSPSADNNYWDSYSFPINQPLTIRTSTPMNFIGLWFALLHKDVAPKDKKDYPIYRQMKTGYTITDVKENSSQQQKLEYERSLANTQFLILLQSDKKSDKKYLKQICKYVGFKANMNAEPSILNSQFMRWIESTSNSLKNAKTFNQAYERFGNQEGREELDTWMKLLEAEKKGKITYSRSKYYLGEEDLGNNLKIAAEMVNKNHNLKTKLLEELENDN